MPRKKDIFGGILQGAGGLLSDLAMRNLRQDDDLERQRQNNAAQLERTNLNNVQRSREALATAFSDSRTPVRQGTQTVPEANSNLSQLASILGIEDVPSFAPLPLASNTANAVSLAGEGGGPDDVLAQMKRLIPDEPGVSGSIEGPPVDVISQALQAPGRSADFERRQGRTALDVPSDEGGEHRIIVDDNGNIVTQVGDDGDPLDPIRTSPSHLQKVQDILRVEGDEDVLQLRADKAEADQAGRNAALYSEEAILARIREGVAVAEATAGATLAAEQREAADLAEREAAAIGPTFASLVTLSGRMNTQEGLAARLSGAAGATSAYAGYNEDVTQYNQFVSAILRPVARASGAKEANISDSDLERVAQVISLSPSSTAAERRNSLRFLRNLLLISPVLAAQLPVDMPYSSRLDMIAGKQSDIENAEEAFIQSLEALESQGYEVGDGDLFFTDPSTGLRLPVVR